MTDTPQIALDLRARIATITLRKRLDIAPTAIDVPFALIKQAAGAIASAEGQLEAQQLAAAQTSLVRPS